MNTSLPQVIDGFSDLHVVVIGEAMLDSYLEGNTGRLCREAPVPIVDLSGRRDAPGGAANTAVNARALGARVTLVSVVGDDPEWPPLREALQARGVGTDAILADPRRRTLAKTRVVAASQLLVRFDQGSTGPVDPEVEQILIDRLTELHHRCDVLIVSDYGYGILTPRVIDTLAELQARDPRVLVADSKCLPAYRRARVTAAKPNYAEVLQLLGVPENGRGRGRADEIATHGHRILDATGARIAAVTLDTEGALILERDRPPYRTYAQASHHSRAAGAGDTFVSALALALAAGAETTAAAELASAAAAVVVGKDGTAACSTLELRASVLADDKPVADLISLAARVESYRHRNKRIVFTNGCFDILHRGHIAYLNRAKALGDILVVGVNTDDGIRRLKGPTRPINTLDDRIQVLAALSCVDHIVPFDEDTPCNLVRVVRPDVFVKGGDYTRELLPEAAIVEALGGAVQILPFVRDRSTTDIINRIRAADAGSDGDIAPGRPVAPRQLVLNGQGDHA